MKNFWSHLQKVHHLNNPMNKGSNKLEIDLPLKVAMEMYCKIEIPSIHIKRLYGFGKLTK